MPLSHFFESDTEVISVSLSENQNLCVSGSADGCVALFDVRANHLLHSLAHAHLGKVNTVLFLTSLASSGDAHILTCSEDDATIRLFSLKSGLKEVLNIATSSGVSSMVTDAPAEHVIGAGISGLRMWSLDNGIETPSLFSSSTMDSAQAHNVSCLVSTTDCSQIVAGCEDGQVHCYTKA